jgi:hypothetical protein
MSETTRPDKGSDDAASEGHRLTDDERERFNDLRGDLLSLHSALLETERAAYERVYGPISNNGEFFHLVVTHEWFSYLKDVSEIVVQIDEWLDSERPLAKRLGRTTAHLPDPDTLIAGVRALLTSVTGEDHFARRYRAALQENPTVVMAHAAIMKSIGPPQTGV